MNGSSGQDDTGQCGSCLRAHKYEIESVNLSFCERRREQPLAECMKWCLCLLCTAGKVRRGGLSTAGTENGAARRLWFFLLVPDHGPAHQGSGSGLSGLALPEDTG